MNKLVTPLIFFVFFLGIDVFAADNDSLAYERQREKINNMLDQRSEKFGQYTESLSKRTGIFGFKTKKDMQKSIDILLDIMLTDNAILKETKILLDYKNFQQQRIVNVSKETDEKNLSYMRTINKLQNQNEKLAQEIKQLKRSKRNSALSILLLSIILGVGSAYIFRKFYSKKN
ncbi:hypothetical protein [Pseudopedobacter sp.]|uniref:hypothetical protein n=1 Tax=Pseudopedobacter sp. TaxID=1936787 RepID=UPI003340078D